MNKLKIHYRDDEVKSLYAKAGIQTVGSAGFDLVACEDVRIEKGGKKLIDLGIVVKIPEGYHALVIPRSSTFNKHGVIQANSCGLIDNDYCGPDDYWKFPAFAPFDEWDNDIHVYIEKGTRICQFILMPTVQFDVEEFIPDGGSRGGFGSSGV